MKHPGHILLIGQLYFVGIPQVLDALYRQAIGGTARNRIKGQGFGANQTDVVQPVGFSHKVGNESGGRAMIDHFRRIVLLDDAAVEHRDFIAHAHRFGLIVGDEHRREAQPGYKILQLMTHLPRPMR